MLTLSRRPTQSILFGDGFLKVKVFEVKNHTVKLAIDAPDWLPILRDELRNERTSAHLTEAEYLILFVLMLRDQDQLKELSIDHYRDEFNKLIGLGFIDSNALTNRGYGFVSSLLNLTVRKAKK